MANSIFPARHCGCDSNTESCTTLSDVLSLSSRPDQEHCRSRLFRIHRSSALCALAWRRAAGSLLRADGLSWTKCPTYWSS